MSWACVCRTRCKLRTWSMGGVWGLVSRTSTPTLSAWIAHLALCVSWCCSLLACLPFGLLCSCGVAVYGGACRVTGDLALGCQLLVKLQLLLFRVVQVSPTLTTQSPLRRACAIAALPTTVTPCGDGPGDIVAVSDASRAGHPRLPVLPSFVTLLPLSLCLPQAGGHPTPRLLSVWLPEADTR